VSSYHEISKRQPAEPEPQPVATLKYGWLRATGRYIVHDKDLVLMKLVTLGTAVMFGIDVGAMIGELPFIWLLPDDVAEGAETIIALILWLIAFRLFHVRKKINYYRYAYHYE